MNSRFSAVLLAGGKSSRMGREKALIEIDGVSLWHRQIRLLEELQPAEIFIAGPDCGADEEEKYTFLEDAAVDAGPLGGLVAALRRCSTTHLLTLAVDLPAITAAHLQQLIASCPPDAGMVPLSTYRHEPLAAIYPASSLFAAEKALARGDYSLQKLCAFGVTHGWLLERMILPEEEPLFLNVNTPADLLAFTHG